jgi:hypothetical protein
MPTPAVNNYSTDLTDEQWELTHSFIVLQTSDRPRISLFVSAKTT